MNDIDQKTIDLMLLYRAYEYAMKYSTDPSTQNAAILIAGNGIQVAIDANRFPKGVQESDVRWARPLKYDFVEHAERTVIYQAARNGIATEGLTMYCPWFACANCARAIIEAGIKEVVGHDTPLHKTRPDWQETIKNAIDMLNEAGVKTRWVEGEMPGIKIRFDGKLVQP